MILEALRLSPRDRQVYLWCLFAGLAKIHLGRYEEATFWLQRSVEENLSFPSSRFALAAAMAHTGRITEARAEAEAGLAITPSFTISRFRADVSHDSPAMAAGHERLIEGLRMAAVPDQ